METTIFDYFKVSSDIKSLESSKVVNFAEPLSLKEELKQKFDVFFADYSNSEESKREKIAKLLESFKNAPELLKGNVLNLKKIYDNQIMMPGQILRDWEAIKSEPFRKNYFNNGVNLAKRLIAQFQIISAVRFLLMNRKLQDILQGEGDVLYEKLKEDFSSLTEAVIKSAGEFKNFLNQFSLDSFTGSYSGDEKLIKENLEKIIDVFLLALSGTASSKLYSGDWIVVSIIGEDFENAVKEKLNEQNFKEKINQLAESLLSSTTSLSDIDKFFFDEWLEKLKKA